METTYDPKKVTGIADGRVITGYAPDGMITITKNADNVTQNVGTQGDVATSISADNTAVAAITLQSTSASLPQIRSLAARNKKFRFSLSDANDDTSIFINSSGCYVQKTPDFMAGKEVGTVTVNILIPNYNPA